MLNELKRFGLDNQKDDVVKVINYPVYLTGVDGLTLYGGISQVEQFQNGAAYSGDVDERVLGIKYAAGGFTVGYQQTDEDTGQTAYDYLLEQKTKILAYYPPLKRKASLKEIIEYEISNPNSKMYKYPRKIVAGDDYQQQFILSIIHRFDQLTQ